MGGRAVSGTKWSDSQVDQHLRSLTFADVLPEAPEVTPELVGRTRAARARRRTDVWWKGAVAAAVVLALLLAGGNRSLVAGMIEMVLGIPIRTMTQEEYAQRSIMDDMAEAPLSALLPEEEPVQDATFPVRNPSWLPDGFALKSGPSGAYMWVYVEGEGWSQPQNPEDFYVTQTYESAEGRRIYLRQSLLGDVPNVSWPPGTERIEVAGHPAFLREDVQPVHVDPPEGVTSEDDWAPESLSVLHLWVSEPDGRITEVMLSGDVSGEILVQVAASLFE